MFRDQKNIKTIKKPLAFRNFVEILEAVTSTAIAYHTESIATMEAVRMLVVDDSFSARQFMKFKLEGLSEETKEMLIIFADVGEKAIKNGRGNYLQPGFSGPGRLRSLS